ncbi:MAG: AAA family ATPase [Chloroflexota bacterium]|nr:AAA family ATPase [Chloroflexota bacterium]
MSARPSARPGRYRSRLVGRGRELARVQAALDGAAAGRGSVVLIEGEPGIGKTRLAHEAAARAARRGFTVLEGSCLVTASGLPFAPLRDALSRRTRDAPALAALPPLPVPVQPARDAADDAYEHRRAVAEFLAGLGETMPVLLVLEDLQWGDLDTVALLPLLARAVRDARCLVVGTYRASELVTGHPLAEVAADLHRARLATRLHLPPLTEAETHELATRILPAEPASAATRELHRRTGGIPFFVEEILLDLVDRGQALPAPAALDGAGSPPPIPEGVSEAVTWRLGRLSARTRQMLELASVLGQRLDFGRFLAAQPDVHPAALLSLLDEAIDARVLVEVPQADDARAYAFVHDLMGEVVYAGIPPSRRAQRHRRVADALSRPGIDATNAAEICHHLLLAGPLATRAEILGAAWAAACHAMDLYAFDSAAAHLRTAAGCAAPGNDPSPASIARHLARALAASGDLTRAVPEYDRALALLAPDADADERVRLRLEVAQELRRVSLDTDAIRYLEQALADTPRASVDTAISVQVELGRCLLWTGRFDEGGRLIAAAVAASATNADPAIRARARYAHADWCARSGDFRSAAQQADGAAQFALEAGDPRSAGAALVSSATWWLQMQEVEEGLSRAARALELAGACRDLTTLTEARSLRALVHCMRGQWMECDAELAAGRDAAAGLRRLPHLSAYLTFVGWQQTLWRGSDDDIGALEAALPAAPLPPVYELARSFFLCRLYVRKGDIEGARAALAPSLRLLPAAPPPGLVDGWIMGVSQVLGGLCDVGDRIAAAEWAGRLQPHGALIVPFASPALELGRAAALNGRWDESLAWLARAQQSALVHHAGPYAALAAYEIGLVYGRRDAAGDAAASRRYLREAMRAFGHLEMRWYEQRAAEAIEAPVSGAACSPLSRRETEILRLVAGGKTNRAIAEALVLSERTVATHIAHIFGKIGVDNRSGATAWAFRTGLVGEERAPGRGPPPSGGPATGSRRRSWP